MATKTDNANIQAKLQLRRWVLGRLNGPLTVVDACAGRQCIWNELKREFAVSSYVAIDQKGICGALRMDSVKYLAAGGWRHNVIDIDTYGSPWDHWLAALPHCTGATAIFLTIGIGRTGRGNAMSNAAKNMIRLPPSTPASICGAFHDLATRYMLSMAAEYGIVREAVETKHGGRARYIGVVLDAKQKGGRRESDI